MKKTIFSFLLGTLTALCILSGCAFPMASQSTSESQQSSTSLQNSSSFESVENSSIEESAESSSPESVESSNESSAESSLESNVESSLESSLEESSSLPEINSSKDSSEEISSEDSSKDSSEEISSEDSSEDSSEEASSEDSSKDSSEEASSEDSSEDSSEEVSSEDSSEEISSEDSSIDSSDDSSEEAPLPLEYDDLATSGCVGSLAPYYGAQNERVIQSEVISHTSEQALKGTFNCIGANAYQGYMVWTWAEFRLADYYGDAQSLSNKTFRYDVRTENCGRYSSIILVDPNGKRSNEVSFDLTCPTTDGASISVTPLNNGWTRIVIDMSMVYFGEDILENVSEVLIMFSNENCDGSKDSVFYLDNARIIDYTSPDNGVSDIPVNNPSGYYSKEEYLYIKIVGNSFVSDTTSNCVSFLSLLCEEFEAEVSISYLSIPNGRIPDQYEQAFGEKGYMQTEEIDVLFIQDFYSNSDMDALGQFLDDLYILSPDTELKIYAGENETSDGLRASVYYGVDYVDWKSAIKTLKTDYGFTAANLNGNDGWHPNPLSGFIGGLMLYMNLYGECPDLTIVEEIAMREVWGWIPGKTDAEKHQNFAFLCEVAIGFVLGN